MIRPNHPELVTAEARPAAHKARETTDSMTERASMTATDLGRTTRDPDLVKATIVNCDWMVLKGEWVDRVLRKIGAV